MFRGNKWGNSATTSKNSILYAPILVPLNLGSLGFDCNHSISYLPNSQKALNGQEFSNTVLQRKGGNNYTSENTQFWAVHQNTTEQEIQVLRVNGSQFLLRFRIYFFFAFLPQYPTILQMSF